MIMPEVIDMCPPSCGDITRFIVERMAQKQYNTMLEIDDFAFDTPLVGFSSAADPLYPFYKNHIDSQFYRLPEEWLKSVYGRDFDPRNVSVISWVLPQTQRTRDLSRASRDCPTMEWQMVRVHGEECNRALAKALEEWLISQGYEAVAPMCSPEFSWGDSERFVLVSNWSERHTAYISGLGTFGLCDGLISKRGKAARYGSVIVNLPLPPTPRDYTAYNEYCQAKNGCTACMRRCPAGAITLQGHDKEKCRAYHRDFIAPICHERYGYDGYSVCGLCQTGVPCEAGIPKKMETGREKENERRRSLL